MATITSAQTGDWSSGSTWVGETPPGDGDIAIRAVNHVITVDSNTTIGDDSGNDVLACYGPASGSDSGGFIIPTGVTLTLKGSMRSGGDGSYISVSGKISIVTNYNGYISPGNANINGYGSLIANGSVSNWAEIDASGSSGDWYIKTGSYYCEILTGSYMRLKNIAEINPGRSIDIDHWIFDSDCGDLSPNLAIIGSRDFSIDNCTFLNSSSSVRMSILPTSGGARSFSGNVVLGTFYAWNYDDIDYDGCVLLGFISGNSNNKGAVTDCFLLGEIVLKTGVYTDNFFFYESSVNPHFLSQYSEVATTVDGCVFEHGGSDVNGGCVLSGTSGYAADIVVKNCIVLPGTSGDASGTLISLHGGSGATATLHNNTSRGTINVGETYAGHADQVDVSVNNLFFGFDTGDQTHLFLTDTDGIFTEADYNSAYGVSAPYDYSPDGYGSSPGGNDVNTDPNLYDSSRDLASWAADDLGSTGATEADRRQDAIDALIAMNDPDDADYNASATPANLVAYIKIGFTPQNTADYLTSGKGGSYLAYIGAVEPEVFASGLMSPMIMRTL